MATIRDTFDPDAIRRRIEEMRDRQEPLVPPTSAFTVHAACNAVEGALLCLASLAVWNRSSLLDASSSTANFVRCRGRAITLWSPIRARQLPHAGD